MAEELDDYTQSFEEIPAPSQEPTGEVLTNPQPATILQQVSRQPSESIREGESYTPRSHVSIAPDNPVSAVVHESSLEGAPHGEEEHAIARISDAFPQPSEDYQPTYADTDEQQPVAAAPRYMSATLVAPKQPLQEYKNAAQEHIFSVFSPANIIGIRSLPNALEPDFRLKLVNAIVHQGQAVTAMHKQQAPRNLSYSLEGGPLAPPVSLGQKQVPRVHPHAGSFTTYQYMPSEYDRHRLMHKFDRLKNKLAQVTPVDFVVKATPSVPKGAPAFSEFEYKADPFMNMERVRVAEENNARQQSLAGPFVAGGSIAWSALIRGRADECMMAMCKLLSADWPTSFLQVFEDSSGAIVVSFDKARAVTEGDLSSYMQHMARNSRVVAEYHLNKDGTQWGLVDDDTQSVFYLFWPPWIRHRYVGSPAREEIHQQEQQQGRPLSSQPQLPTPTISPRPGNMGGAATGADASLAQPYERLSSTSYLAGHSSANNLPYAGSLRRPEGSFATVSGSNLAGAAGAAGPGQMGGRTSLGPVGASGAGALRFNPAAVGMQLPAAVEPLA